MLTVPFENYFMFEQLMQHNLLSNWSFFFQFFLSHVGANANVKVSTANLITTNVFTTNMITVSCKLKCFFFGISLTGDFMVEGKRQLCMFAVGLNACLLNL